MLKKIFPILILVFGLSLTISQVRAISLPAELAARQPRLPRSVLNLPGFICDRLADRFFNLPFCEPADESEEPAAFCGDGLVNQPAEECDGIAGVPSGFTCNVSCLLEELPVTQVVINEIYANVSLEKGDEPANEWLELYNTGNTSVNLLDWLVEDSSNSSDLLPVDVTLEPGEFALVTPNLSTFDEFWAAEVDPAAGIIIIDGATIGNGLGNGGDGLILKNAQGIMDGMSYGEDISFFSLPAAAGGQSLSRVPNGQDTNTAADWEVSDEPTPGF